MAETRVTASNPELIAEYWRQAGEAFSRAVSDVLAERGPTLLQKAFAPRQRKVAKHG